MKSYTRRTPEQWQQLVSEQKSTGLSVPQFCKHRNIANASFYAWRKRLSHLVTNQAEPEAAFIELNVEPEKVVSHQWAVELELGGGMCLRIATH